MFSSVFKLSIFFNPLIWLSLIPLAAIVILFLIPQKFVTPIKIFTLTVTCVVFLGSLLLWINFFNYTSFFQFSDSFQLTSHFNFYYSVGLDGISLFFLILSTFLIMICILISWNSVTFLLKEYLICFLFLDFCLIQVFSVLDIFLFYIFFESVLIPMFLIIGIWGSRERKVRASVQFFLYTLIGSFFMLTAIIFIYSITGSTDLTILWFTEFSHFHQVILWIAFFFGLAVKIPMIPFHIWLPEAHAEAPTSGSVILAGILLKLGGFGFLRFSLPIFPYASMYFAPFIFILSLIAIIYGSLTTLRQIDLKKIIAYSSISHMGFVTLGIFSLSTIGLEGSIILMLSHGFVSSAMFFCVGVLYDRHKTRILKYYSGLTQVMPLFSVFFLFFSLANISFPTTSSFIGELLILSSLLNISFFLTFFTSFGIIFSVSYTIWLNNRLNFGSLKIQYFDNFQDVSRREFFIMLLLAFVILWIGIYPTLFINEINFSVLNLVEHLSI
uniref:NADH dehydrogenase subunit 4 n=1 Tax=Bostrychia moritziana TaxID=103713 RepID=UPI002E7A0CC4|nr:NADH dehydrogenase subunit 4 [Bostrychia moritziana]WQF69400.1 NADH dehydrogenase subunit 4 [Bostrychia moritziana]WQF69423.1 NADH dehydrogenase subunit 4 [Bostrychia moritziana]